AVATARAKVMAGEVEPLWYANGREAAHDVNERFTRLAARMAPGHYAPRIQRVTGRDDGLFQVELVQDQLMGDSLTRYALVDGAGNSIGPVGTSYESVGRHGRRVVVEPKH